MKPIDYAVAACETLMRKYEAEKLPPVGHFCYHQGVFLSGMYETYQLTGDERYFAYIKAWVDSVFDKDGRIRDCAFADLDDIQPGILLFPILDRTGDPYYLRCLNAVYEEVRAIPRNPLGGYYHKTNMIEQMWLDGLYMAGPFCAQYAKRYHVKWLADTVVQQALLMEKLTRDENTGLLYHAWDGARKEPWADRETGRSHEFWGRSMGWVPVALLDDLDFLPAASRAYGQLADMAVRLLEALCRYQAEDGRWYQVVDKGGREGNWLENSCACLYVAALCKAVRLGLMNDAYRENAARGYAGVIRSLSWQGDDLQIGNVCIGTGVGDYQHYIHRPVSVNDLHGVGAFLLMCAQAEKTLNAREVRL